MKTALRTTAMILKDMEETQSLMLDYHGKMGDMTATAEQRTEAGVLFGKKREAFDVLNRELNDVKALEASQAVIDGAKSNPPQFGGVNFTPQTQQPDSDLAGKAGNPPVGGQLHTKENPLVNYRSKCDSVNAFSGIEISPNYVQDQMIRGKIFADWFAFGAEKMDGEAVEAIRCKDARALQNAQGDLLCSMPKFMSEFVRAKSVGAPGGHRHLVDSYSGKVILSTDATGGVTDSGAANLLAPDFRALLLEYPIYAPEVYSLCQQFRAYNGRVEWPMLDQDQGDYGGVAFTWKGTEGADKGETEPVFKDFEITTAELSGWTELSLQALRRSSIDLQATIMRLFRTAAVAEWSNMVLHGSGTNRPLGLLHANASGVTTIARQQADKVGWKDLTQLEYAIRRAQRFGARYVIDDTVEQYLKDLTDGLGRPLFTSDVHSQIRENLAGYPYLTHTYGSVDLGTAGDVLFGNFNSYGFAMEEEIAIARSEHAEFKKGRVVYRMICFVGGKPIYQSHFAKLGNPA